MKIDNNLNRETMFNPLAESESSKKEKNKRKNFHSILNLKRHKIDSQDIQDLMSKIENQGLILEKSPTIKDFENYRNLIKKLLQKTLMNTFGVASETNPRTQKIYVSVQTIDRELESLLQMIHKKEQNRITISESVLKIKGLILDVFR